MSHVAFDLDGVLLCDTYVPKDKDDTACDLKTVLKFRIRNMLALFTPDKRYAIITGRPECDSDETWAWITTNLIGNMPLDVYHGRPWISGEFDIATHTVGAAEYKAQILNEDTLIDVYIESDIEQVEYLNKHVRPTCAILHFETIIKNAIQSEVEKQRRLQWQKSF